MKRSEYIHHILGDRLNNPPRDEASAFAPANIALCKYWGKRNTELNLPATDSLSISLGNLGATTSLRLSDRDTVILNGHAVDETSSFYKRAFEFINLFRQPGLHLELNTDSTIPVAAGLASSASGFAALVLAMNDLFQWKASHAECSLLARVGSGSACRSIEHGFVHWQAGSRDDGMDSYAKRIELEWPEFRIGLLVLESGAKPIGSREAMNRTVETSVLYQSWPQQVQQDLQKIQQGLQDKDFNVIGATAEENALAMHATMMASRPPVIYWTPKSLELIRRIQALRAGGLQVYLTMDAGPNVKILYLKNDASRILSEFPSLKEVCPFSANDLERGQ